MLNIVLVTAGGCLLTRQQQRCCQHVLSLQWMLSQSQGDHKQDDMLITTDRMLITASQTPNS